MKKSGFLMFLKFCWYLSVVFLFIFTILDIYRALDCIQGNYSTKQMQVTNCEYHNRSAKTSESISVYGNIEGEEVSLYMYSGGVDKIEELYPIIFSEDTSIKTINVIKFKNSRKVLIPEELESWKNFLLCSSLYIFISIIMIIIKFRKKMTKKILLLFILLFKTSIYSQEVFKVKNLMVTNSINGRLTIEKYTDNEMHKTQKCAYPEYSAEQKFCMFFNLNTKEELAQFFNPYEIPSSYSKKDYLSNMKVYNSKSNFYKLDSKYTLDYGISKDIFIKYINYNEDFPKPVYFVSYLQSFNENLIIKDMGENFDLGMFLINSNTKKTIEYLNKHKNEEIDISLFCNDFLKNLKDNNSNALIDEKYSPFFDNQVGYNILSDENIQNKNTYEYKKTFHDLISGVILEKKVLSKEEVSKKYNIPTENIKQDSLSVKEIIEVNTLNNNFTIIKFYDYKPIIKTKYEILNNYLLNKSINLLTILIKLSLDFIVELFVNDNSDKFPEINKLKPLVKDTDGTLNLFKLAEVIEKNKNSLAKYLEE